MYVRTLYVPEMYIPVYTPNIWFRFLFGPRTYVVLPSSSYLLYNYLYGAGVGKKRAHILYVSNTYEVTSRSTTSMVAQ